MEDLATFIAQINARSVLDILLVTIVIYGILRLFAGTQGVQLLRGVLVLVLIAVLASNFTGLAAFSWFIRNSGLVALFALPVIFQPELRRALERLGRTGRLLPRAQRSPAAAKVISELISACSLMSQLRQGALIVLENRTGLQDIVETGVRVAANLNADLLLTIFTPRTPLHDGAVIIRDLRIEAAACVLPLTQQSMPDTRYGTRHRAALGITEETDALVLVVSEETGTISVAYDGRMVRHMDERSLRNILLRFFDGLDPDIENATQPVTKPAETSMPAASAVPADLPKRDADL